MEMNTSQQLNELKAAAHDVFAKTFTEKSSHCVLSVAPGRVNLIGDHTDYNGYDVLPCAIAKYTVCILNLVDNSDHSLPAMTVVHVNNTLHAPRTYPVGHVEIGEDHFWTDYCVAAYKGVSEFADNGSSGLVTNLATSSVQLVVTGNIPEAAGLSSSSSLVVAVVQGLAQLLHINLSHLEMAQLCIASERHVGTASGGMDQTAIIAGWRGCAMNISFDPLIVRRAALPRQLSFVVANTGVSSAKAITAPFQYNKRWFECRVGTIILRAALQLPEVFNLVDDTFARVAAAAGKSLVEMISVAQKYLRVEAYTRSDIEAAIGIESVHSLLNGRCGWKVWELNDNFLLQQRAVHVFQEASSVRSFLDVCQTIEAGTAGHCPEEALGRLMDLSDSSCDNLYECSCTELRDLTLCFRQGGALGSRLTGAGWGGCAVAMVHTDRLDTMLRFVNEKYFVPRGLDVSKYMFSFEPQGGAFVEDIRVACFSKSSSLSTGIMHE